MEELKQEGKKNYKGLIRINDPKKTYWDLFSIFLAVFNCYAIPFEVAFSPPIMEGAVFLAVNTCIDFCFLLDILAAFRTTYYDANTGDEVCNKA